MKKTKVGKPALQEGEKAATLSFSVSKKDHDEFKEIAEKEGKRPSEFFRDVWAYWKTQYKQITGYKDD